MHTYFSVNIHFTQKCILLEELWQADLTAIITYFTRLRIRTTSQRFLLNRMNLYEWPTPNPAPEIPLTGV